MTTPEVRPDAPPSARIPLFSTSTGPIIGRRLHPVLLAALAILVGLAGLAPTATAQVRECPEAPNGICPDEPPPAPKPNGGSPSGGSVGIGFSFTFPWKLPWTRDDAPDATYGPDGPGCELPTVRADELTLGACPAWRWVGKLSPGEIACPQAPAPWLTSPLYPAHPDHPRLDRYCVYLHPGSGGELPAAVDAAFESLEESCMGLVPQSGNSGEISPMTQILEARFLDRAGGFFDLPADRSSVPRLAILDTSPTNDTDPARFRSRSPHGDTLIHAARRLLCRPDGAGQPECAARITSRLALPWARFDPSSYIGSLRDEEHGGQVGMISDLGVAIVDEIDAWKADGNDGTPGTPLVLNLSLGWDGELFGGFAPDELPPEVGAVLDALRYAAESPRVAVFASAGNRRWGPDEASKAVLPAAWEGELWTWVRAEEAGTGSSPPSRPLLRAVGALDGEDRPLANARPAVARTLLNAYGDHVVVPYQDPGGEPSARPDWPWDQPPQLQPLTGTSASALVVSAAAALTWSQQDQLDAAGLDLYLRTQGRPMAGRSELASPTHIDTTARGIELCSLLEKPSCQKPRALPTFARASSSTLDLAKTEADAPRSFAPCKGGQSMNAEGTLFPCPHFQLPGWQAASGTHPQPDSDLCPDCNFNRGGGGGGGGGGGHRLAATGDTGGNIGGLVHLSFGPDLPRTATEAVLQIGDHAMVVPLGGTEWPPNFSVRLPKAVLQDFSPGKMALVSVQLDGRRSMVSPLLVLP